MRKLFQLLTISTILLSFSFAPCIVAKTTTEDAEDDEMWEDIFDTLFQPKGGSSITDIPRTGKDARGPKKIAIDEPDDPEKNFIASLQLPKKERGKGLKVEVSEKKRAAFTGKISEFQKTLARISNATKSYELEGRMIETLKPHATLIETAREKIGIIQSKKLYLRVFFEPQFTKLRKQIISATKSLQTIEHQLNTHIEKINLFKKDQQLSEYEILQQYRLPPSERTKEIEISQKMRDEQKKISKQITTALSKNMKPIVKQLEKVVTSSKATQAIESKKKKHEAEEKAADTRLRQQTKYPQPEGNTEYKTGSSEWYPPSYGSRPGYQQGGHRDSSGYRDSRGHQDSYYDEDKEARTGYTGTTPENTTEKTAKEKDRSFGFGKRKKDEDERKRDLPSEIEGLVSLANKIAGKLAMRNKPKNSFDDSSIKELLENNFDEFSIVALNDIVKELAKRKTEWAQTPKPKKTIVGELPNKDSEAQAKKEKESKKKEIPLVSFSSILNKQFIKTLLQLCKFHDHETLSAHLMDGQSAATSVYNTIKNEWQDFVRKPFTEEANNQLGILENLYEGNIKTIISGSTEIPSIFEISIANGRTILTLDMEDLPELRLISAQGVGETYALLLQTIKMVKSISKYPTKNPNRYKKILNAKFNDFVQKAELFADYKHSSAIMTKTEREKQRAGSDPQANVSVSLLLTKDVASRLRGMLKIGPHPTLKKRSQQKIQIIEAIYGNLQSGDANAGTIDFETGNIKSIEQVDTIKQTVETISADDFIDTDQKIATLTIVFSESHLDPTLYGPAPRKLFVRFRVDNKEFCKIYEETEPGSIFVQLGWYEQPTQTEGEKSLTEDQQEIELIPEVEPIPEEQKIYKAKTIMWKLLGVGAIAAVVTGAYLWKQGRNKEK